MSHHLQPPHFKVLTIGLLASVLGFTTVGCTASTTATSSPSPSTPAIVASVPSDATAPSSTPIVETTPVSVENVETTPPPIVVDQIEDGRRNHWCLSTLAPKGKISACTAEGWNVTKLETAPDATSQESPSGELPFVGTRLFNFEGGSGTGQSITIEADGTTTVKAHGTMQTFIRYTGKFANPILFEDGFGVRLNGNKIQLVTSDDPTGERCQSRGPCETTLYQPSGR
jgi:hypothetical protein